MSYSKKDYNYYISNPKKINNLLSEELLLELIDVNSSWLKYMAPYDLNFIKKAMNIDPTIFPYINRDVFTIQFLEAVIDVTPSLIQYVYAPNDDLVKLALSRDWNVMTYFKKLPENIYIWLVSQNGLLLSKIPGIHHNKDVVLAAITQNYKAYKHAIYKDLDLDRLVIAQDAKMVEYISTYDISMLDKILEFNPMYIVKFIGDSRLTEQNIMDAITRNPEVFKVIPSPSFAIKKHAATQDLSLIKYMQYSQSLIDAVIKVDGMALKYVRKKDLFTIVEAIKLNILSLQFVTNPRKHLVDYAFELDGIAIQFIESPTNDQYYDAVARNPYAIEFVPYSLQTEKLQLYALNNCDQSITKYIKPITMDVTMEILRKLPTYIFDIETPTNSMYQLAFSSNGALIMFYADWHRTFSSDIIVSALSNDGSLLNYISAKTTEMIMAAISNFPAALQWVQFQTKEIVKYAVEKDPRVIFFADKNVLDTELLLVAKNQDPDYFTITSGELTWEQWKEKIKENT